MENFRTFCPRNFCRQAVGPIWQLKRIWVLSLSNWSDPNSVQSNIGPMFDVSKGCRSLKAFIVVFLSQDIIYNIQNFLGRNGVETCASLSQFSKLNRSLHFISKFFLSHFYVGEVTFILETLSKLSEQVIILKIIILSPPLNPSGMKVK